MREDKRPVFGKRNGIASRMAKIEALSQVNTPEARKERKRMNVHVYRRGAVNVTGFYHPKGKAPVRCK